MARNLSEVAGTVVDAGSKLAAPSPRKADIARAFLMLRQASDHTIAEAARLAGVSPNSWWALEQEKFGPSSPQEFVDRGSRKQRAWAQTALRLYNYFRRARQKDAPDFDRDEFLSALGIETDSDALKSILQEERSPTALGTSDAWDSLKSGQLRTGLANWTPFNRGLDRGAPQPFRSTLGWRLVSSVLGAAAPEQIDNISCELLSDIAAATQKLSERAYGLLLGFYDTPDRRILNLDFVALPGIAFTLSVLTTEQAKDKYWEALLHDLLRGVQATRRIAVWEPDSGYNFIRGYCNVEPQITLRGNLVAADMAKQLAAASFETVGGASRPIAFFGDTLLCHAIKSETSRLAIDGHPIPKFAVIQLHQSAIVAPQYRAGFLLRSGDRLHSLIRSYFEENAYPSFLSILAYEYARLFLEGMFLPDVEGGYLQHILLTRLDYKDEAMINKFVEACLYEISRLAESYQSEIVAMVTREVEGWRPASLK